MESGTRTNGECDHAFSWRLVLRAPFLSRGFDLERLAFGTHWEARAKLPGLSGNDRRWVIRLSDLQASSLRLCRLILGSKSPIVLVKLLCIVCIFFFHDCNCSDDINDIEKKKIKFLIRD